MRIATPAFVNFPQRFRDLWHSATTLLHAVNALQAKASEAVRSAGITFTWPNEPKLEFCVSKREFCEVLDVTRECFLRVRNEAPTPWVHVARLLSLCDRTYWALSVLLETSPDHRSQVDEAREALTPMSTEELAVILECIHAEIRLATAQITPRFDSECPHDFICELLCAKSVGTITPEARDWIEAHVTTVEMQLDALKHPAPRLDFADCPPLDFVGHIGLVPLNIEGECVELRRILASSSPAVATDRRLWTTTVDQPVSLWELTEPGLFRFNGKQYDLTQVPLKMLTIFVESHREAFRVEHLRPALRDEVAHNDSVRPQLSKLRDVLRQVASDFDFPSDVKEDPIPHKNGGWRFLLPRRL